jgi:phosphate/sulfate permease
MEQVVKYFQEEKQGSIIFLIVGLFAILGGIYVCFVVKKTFMQGLAIPLIVVGLIQLTVGATIFLRSDQDVLRVQQMLETSPSQIAKEEVPRMQKVTSNFSIYRLIEIVLILLGIILMFGFGESDFRKGIGLGLFIQASLMLVLDFFAERRGLHYFDYLLTLV